MATIKDLLSSMISKINSKVSTWEELPDKPFGVVREMTTIIPEFLIDDPELNTKYDMATYISGEYMDIMQEITVGDVCEVVINGISYRCTASEFDYAIALMVYIEGIETSVLNILTYAEGELEVSWKISVFGTSLTLELHKEVNVVKQIDPKFVGGGSDGSTEPDIVFETAGSFNLANTKVDNIEIVGGAEKVAELIQKLQAGKFPKAAIRNAWRYGNYTCVDVYHGTRIFHNHGAGCIIFNFQNTDYDVELIVNNEGVISSFTRTSRN